MGIYTLPPPIPSDYCHLSVTRVQHHIAQTITKTAHLGLDGKLSHLLASRPHYHAHQFFLSKGIIPSVQVGVARKNGVHVPWNSSATEHKMKGRGEERGR